MCYYGRPLLHTYVHRVRHTGNDLGRFASLKLNIVRLCGTTSGTLVVQLALLAKLHFRAKVWTV